MLKEHLGIWRMAQPLHGLRTLIASGGIDSLVVDATAGWTRTVFAAACVALVTGALTRSWLPLPASHPELQVPGRYAVCLAIHDLRPAHDRRACVPRYRPVDRRLSAWLTLGADSPLPGDYMRFRDIPPFVFYVLVLVPSGEWLHASPNRGARRPSR
jgi:hypothetical protein